MQQVLAAFKPLHSKEIADVEGERVQKAFQLSESGSIEPQHTLRRGDNR